MPAKKISKLEIANAKIDEYAATIQDTERALIQANTEHTVALAFRERYEDRLIFDHNSKTWLEWTGQFWAADKTGKALDYCRKIAASVGDKATQRSSFMEGVERLSRVDRVFASNSNLFDLDNYLLNCPDGTYDLRSGERYDHDPRDLITNITSCSPIAGYGERFPKFLGEITRGDVGMEKFLQVALGACLSGALESAWLMFWIGNGRNGKNTLGDAVMRIMGTYARKIPASTLMMKKNEGHPTEIAFLKGCRLAIASEVDQSAFWSEARINELTGDARLTARVMRGDPFEFEKTFKLLIYGNHRPKLNSITDALKDRIKMVRFGADFTGRDGNPPPDPELPKSLRSEDGHILQWLIDGHTLWVNNGKRLPKCAAVEAEIADYMESQATPDNWMDECLDPERPIMKAEWATVPELYKHYARWKQERNEHTVSQSNWHEAMVRRKHVRDKTKKGNCYNVRLKPDEVDRFKAYLFKDS